MNTPKTSQKQNFFQSIAQAYRQLWEMIKKYQIWIKWAIFIICLYFIFNSIHYNEQINKRFLEIVYSSLDINNIFIYMLLLILMMMNYSIHAISWQYAVRKIQILSFFGALKGVYTGITVSFSMPSYVGTLLGRVWHMNVSERYRALGATSIQSICQHYAYLLVGGMVILIYLIENRLYSISYWYLVIFLICTILFFFFIPNIISLIRFLPERSTVFKSVEILKSYHYKDLAYLSFLSIIRLLVILTQFWLAFILFDSSVAIFLVYAGVSALLTIKVYLPSFGFLIDLGTREAIAIYIFNLLGVDATITLVATLLVWLVNQVLPAVVGLIFLRQAKLA